MRTLTLRELNRTYLHRQLLLERSHLPITKAIAHLVALQSQVQNPPYIGLWSRLHDFQRESLGALMEQRQVVRASWIRYTLHLMLASDYLQHRAAVQAALTKGHSGFHEPHLKGLDEAPIIAAARQFYDGTPRTFADLRATLGPLAPERRPETIASIARTNLPLVQVYPAGTWRTGGDVYYALADQWLAGTLHPDPDPRPLLRRYLASHGPASVKDMQAWAGMTKLKEAVEAIPDLVTYKAPDGTTLYDLPDGEIVDSDTPATVRFMPEYDNLILSHSDRTRVMPDAYRKQVYLSAGRVRSTVLVDGMVGAVWKITRHKATATLTIEALAPFPDEAAVLAEGERLLRWVEDDAEDYAVEVMNLA